MFQKSHKFENAVLVFKMKSFKNLSNNLDFLFKMCVKEVLEYYKLVLNILSVD